MYHVDDDFVLLIYCIGIILLLTILPYSGINFIFLIQGPSKWPCLWWMRLTVSPSGDMRLDQVCESDRVSVVVVRVVVVSVVVVVVLYCHSVFKRVR